MLPVPAAAGTRVAPRVRPPSSAGTSSGGAFRARPGAAPPPGRAAGSGTTTGGSRRWRRDNERLPGGRQPAAGPTRTRATPWAANPATGRSRIAGHLGRQLTLLQYPLPETQILKQTQKEKTLSSEMSPRAAPEPGKINLLAQKAMKTPPAASLPARPPSIPPPAGFAEPGGHAS